MSLVNFLALLLIGICEIALSALVLSKLVESLRFRMPKKWLGISLGSTAIAWLLPTEHALGATFISGWFEPWTWPVALAAWLFVAFPAAIIFNGSN